MDDVTDHTLQGSAEPHSFAGSKWHSFNVNIQKGIIDTQSWAPVALGYDAQW
jgi:hypothetical protein